MLDFDDFEPKSCHFMRFLINFNSKSIRNEQKSLKIEKAYF